MEGGGAGLNGFKGILPHIHWQLGFKGILHQAFKLFIFEAKFVEKGDVDDVNFCIRILESMFVFVAEFLGVKLLMFGCFGCVVLLCPKSFDEI